LEIKSFRVMKIAVTVNSNQTSIWSSGINQNGAYLAKMLKEGGHSVDLLSQTKGNYSFVKEVKDLIGLDIIEISEAVDVGYDVVIQLGLALSKEYHDKFILSNPKMKLVAYKCGNDFLTDMETIIFGNEKRENAFSDRGIDAIPDQIWMIPQMEKTCYSYYKFQLKQEKATVVPFIWDPISVESLSKKSSYSTYTKRDINRIAIMEPNISVMKNVFHPLLSVNEASKSIDIKSVMMIGADRIKDRPRLLQILSDMQLFKDKKITAESRHPTLNIINNHADLVLSWQWENNLNYLYLDVAWMGWPIVHNASMCKDVGYYYSEFNVEQSAEVVCHVIKNHNNDIEYLNRNRKIISRYTSKNPKMIEQYNELLEDLVNDKFRRRTYDVNKNEIR